MYTIKAGNYIKIIIKSFSGNISLAAKVMGIGRNTLYRKITKYHIECSTVEHYSKVAQKWTEKVFLNGTVDLFPVIVCLKY